jgi:hypothetical protein
MTLAILTTPVARYSVPELLVNYWVSAVIRTPGQCIEVYNAMGERIQLIGDDGIVPAIWTHTPVPLGFPIDAVHTQFEQRAAVVLSDGEFPVDFSRIDENRYANAIVTCAWMMYLDLAISQRQ